jgi:hypothetical protein
MRTITLTDEERNELMELLYEELDRIGAAWGDQRPADYDNDDPDMISDKHRESVLKDVLHLLEIS